MSVFLILNKNKEHDDKGYDVSIIICDLSAEASVDLFENLAFRWLNYRKRFSNKSCILL
jgi:hypothetical protein